MKSRSRLIAVGMATTAELTVSLVAAVPAQAVPPTVPAIELPAGVGGDSSFLSEYGATSPAARVIPIGPATTSLAISPPFDPFYELACSLEDAAGTLVAERYWGEGDVDQAPPFVMPVPSASITTSGGPYLVDCSSQAESTSRVQWTLTADAAAPAAVVLEHDPITYVRLTEFEPLDGGSYALDTPVALGERVRIRGSAGTWFPAGAGYDLATSIEVPDGDFPFWSGPAEEEAATASGDVVGLTIPESLPASAGTAIRVFARARSTVAGTATTPETTTVRSWSTRLVVVDKAATSAALRLDRTLALTSRATVRAHVTITAGPTETIAGRVSLFIDGKPSSQAAITGIGEATTTIRLPKLGRGSHAIVAVFEGGDSLLGSTSPSRSVRILL
ncbi:Ig-like domain-containing protein [Leifsonia sp. YIM 134122]|uniref:Ig-like domain-containing protein n=1 Tax=Leifsonia stereocauli TaxID=3134136 RepID=A0ABU9W270_9MICO